MVVSAMSSYQDREDAKTIAGGCLLIFLILGLALLCGVVAWVWKAVL